MNRFCWLLTSWAVCILAAASPALAEEAAKDATKPAETRAAKPDAEKEKAAEAAKAEAAKAEAAKAESAKAAAAKEAASKAADAAKTAAPATPATATPATAAAAPAKPAIPSSDVHKIKAAPFKVQVDLEGTFEAKQMTEVILRPQVWTYLTVRTAVEQGTPVRKGDVLMTFDRTRVAEEVHDLEVAAKLTDLSIQQLEAEIRTVEPLIPLDLAAAERAKKIADSDLQQFVEIDRNLTIRQAEFAVKYSAAMLSYYQEELKQLEKMYKADDLTEDTEEIILKRQRDYVDFATFALDNAKIDQEKTKSIQLPRHEESLKEAVSRYALALKKTQTTLPMSLHKSQLELEKQRYEQAKSAERLAKMLADMEAMTVKSPADGLVYYGACIRGQWTSAMSIADRLRRGGNVAPHEVIMTIVEPRPLIVRATVPESDLHQVVLGTTGYAAPISYPKQRFATTVFQVSGVPEASGRFTAALSVDLPLGSGPPMPGMDCKVRLVTYAKEKAITVPSKAVFTDEIDDRKEYVYLVGADGKPTRKDITTGRTAAGKVEVLAGLDEGQSIMLKKPDGET